MIGHTKAAAGLASLIKVAKALHHKVLPPTIGVKTPNPACHFEKGPLYINSETRPWLLPIADTTKVDVRRAGVSAFGFGGTNFHAVLEEYNPSESLLTEASEDPVMPAEIFVFNGASRSEIIRSINALEDKISKLLPEQANENLVLPRLAYWQFLRNCEHSKTSEYCLAVVATSAADLKEKLGRARNDIESSKLSIKDPRGIYFQTNSLNSSAKLAFLFPGQGSQYPGMVSDLTVRFAEVRQSITQANELLKENLSKPLSEYIYPQPSFTKEEELASKEALTDTRIAQPAMGAGNIAILSLLKSFAVTPDMMAGHSYGEYVALCASGYFDFSDLMHISAQRGQILAQPINGQAIPGAMVAVSCSAEELAKYSSDLKGNISVANFNSPKQTVLGGAVGDIEQAILALQDKGLVARRIPVSQAFHTQSMKGASDKIAAVLGKIEFSPGTVDVYSNLDGGKYEKLPIDLSARLARHTVEPVDFVKQINNMYADGARIFLEVGPGNVLSNLSESILAEHTDTVCIAVDKQGRHGIINLLHALAQLAANGVSIDLQRLYQYRLTELRSIFDSISLPAKSSQNKTNKKLVYLVNSASIRQKGQPVGVAAERAAEKIITPVASNDAKASTSGSRNIQDGNLKNQKLANLTTASAREVPLINAHSKAISSNNEQMVATNGRAEQIMLQFQQTMQQMANSFLETQQRVMLAYLETQRDDTINLSVQSNLKSDATDKLFAIPVQSQSIAGLEPLKGVLTDEGSGSGQTSSALAIINEDNGQSPEVQPDTEYLISTLLEIVAERTGYPSDMIDPNLDLEADLGIDSIKRVEILNKFRRVLPESKQRQLETGIEELAGTRTLQGIIDWLRANQDQDNMTTIVVSEPDSHSDNNGGNGKHDSGSNLKVEQIDGQQYVQTGKAVAHAMVGHNGAHSDSNGGNGKEETIKVKAIGNGNDLQMVVDNQPTENSVTSVMRRAVVSPIALPELVPTDAQLAAKVSEIQKAGSLILIVGDQHGLANTLGELFTEYGFKPVVIRQSSSRSPQDNGKHTALPAGMIDCEIDMQNFEQIQSSLDQLQSSSGKVAMLFHLQSFAEQSTDLNRTSAINLMHLLKYLSLNATKHDGQRLITATTMGGKFGIGQTVASQFFSPGQAAVVGLTKVAAKEMPTLVCKAIDFDLSPKENADAPDSGQLIDIAKKLLIESLLDESIIETGYSSGERFALSVVDSPVKQELSKIVLGQSPVFLITGGARGITADIAFEIARQYKPVLILVGRSALPTGDENLCYKGLSGVRELKAKIIESLREEGKPVSIPQVESRYQSLIRDREIRNNIQRLENVAEKVEYYSVDVRDNQAFTELIERIYSEHKKIDAVIHGAGVIEDALLKDKSSESFQRVFDTKVNSALTLINALNKDSLKYLFLFSSVVGRTGNAGQSDYVAANEVLNKLAITVQSQMSGRAASIMWGPWRGGMAQPELEAIFAQYGWAMIDVPTGCAAFSDEMLCSSRNPEVLFVAEPKDKYQRPAVGARLHKSDLRVNAAGDSEYVFELDTQVDAFLMDHAFDGVPVLPMAYALELMCEAACSTYPDLFLKIIESFDIPAGVLFDSQRKKLSIVVHEEKNRPNQVIAVVSIISGVTRRRENFRARFLMGEFFHLTSPPSGMPTRLDLNTQTEQTQLNKSAANSAPFDTGAAITLPPLVEIYRQWLFHGPMFHGIQKINAVGEKGIWGQVAGLSSGKCLHLSSPDEWVIDPVMFDSAMQLGGIWARCSLDITVLPTGFKRLQFFAHPECAPGNVLTAYVSISQADSKNELSCDLAIYNQSGELSILMEGLNGVGSKSLHRLASQNATTEASVPR